MNPFCQQSSHLEGWDGLRCSSLKAMGALFWGLPSTLPPH